MALENDRGLNQAGEKMMPSRDAVNARREGLLDAAHRSRLVADLVSVSAKSAR